MPEARLHHVATLTEIALAGVTFAALWFFAAPYGRHRRAGFGPGVPQRLGWILMEVPAVVVWAAIYFSGSHAFESAPLVMLALWQLHYVHRTFVFPFRIRTADTTTPVGVVASAIVFNLLNAYVNARWVSELGHYPASWLGSPPFLVGAAVFLAGLMINVSSDNILLALRKSRGEGGYSVPRGGLFRWVSCPNYLGELIEWIGWAILTWSVAGTAFALYTAANLVPRAVQHHRWYHERFPDYPPERRALVPGLF